MPRYLVETYLPAATKWAVGIEDAVPREFARRLVDHRRGVSCVRFLVVPEDDVCFYVLDGPSLPVVQDVAVRAGLEPLRVVRAETS